MIVRRRRLPCTAWIRCLAQLLAIDATSDDVANRLLDAAPVVLLSNGGGGLVDAPVLLVMNTTGNLKLAGRVGYHLLILEHELVAVEELIVRRRAAE